MNINLDNHSIKTQHYDPKNQEKEPFKVSS